MTIALRLTVGFGMTVGLVALLAVVALIQLHGFSRQLRAISQLAHGRRLHAFRSTNIERCR